MAQSLILQPGPHVSGVAIAEKAAVKHFAHQMESPSTERKELRLSEVQDATSQAFRSEVSAGKVRDFFGNSEVVEDSGEHSRCNADAGRNPILKELPKYTMDEIARHNTITDLWVVIDNDVYDMTEFQHKHPGGYKVMRGVAGKDATKKFDKYHRRAVLVPKKETLLIGTMNAEDAQIDQTKHKRGLIRRFGFWSSH